MNKIEYGRPDERHLEDLYQLEKTSFASPWDIEEIRGLVRRSLSLFTLAAFFHGKPVGYISAVFSEPGVLHVISLCAGNEFRRRGIAGHLLSCALQWGKHMEARRVVLEVREGNAAAIGFYRRWGFSATGTIENFYGRGIHGIYMERSLKPVKGTLESLLFLNSRLKKGPKLGVILGSGLGWVTESFGCGTSIPFPDIPGMAGDAVQGHAQKLQTSEDGSVVFLMGRRHHYQGYSGGEITLLPSSLAALGVDRWLLTSSAGAVDPDYSVGDVMIFDDHINFSGCVPEPPLKPVGAGVYSLELGRIAEETLRSPRRGVFACVSGPAYETAAEVGLIRRAGGSAVSMSTAQEAMALRALGCRVLALALITNSTDSGDSVCHEEVLSAQEVLRKRQGDSIVELIERLKS